jgi:2-polyprenyl-3-methyl-5-hydroxy-6-metoxy-1,4-benzoquinol methylase
MPDAGRELYAAEIERHVLALREALVRHDENWKAHQLMENVPYFVEERPAIAKARADQREMVKHILDPAEYKAYYEANIYERPFEEQYGVTVEQAHEAIHRVGFLRRRLEKSGLDEQPRVLDLSANDGWMAANLGLTGCLTDCIDLHPGNCELARKRAKEYEGIGKVGQGDLHLAQLVLGNEVPYDAVVLFETIEHVPDPRASLEVMVRLCAPWGRLYVSTPEEAVEDGYLPNWDFVERKGHVRVFTVESFQRLLGEFGSIEAFEIGPDGVMVAEVSPARQ